MQLVVGAGITAPIYHFLPALFLSCPPAWSPGSIPSLTTVCGLPKATEIKAYAIVLSGKDVIAAASPHMRILTAQLY